MEIVQSNSIQDLIINKRKLLKRLSIFWGIIILLLAFADIFINHLEWWIQSGAIHRLVNITRDDGLPNWFSSIQLLAIGIILWCIFFVLVYSKPSLIVKKIEKFGWGLIALFFTYLAVDDGSKLHERIGTAFSNSMESRQEYNPGFMSNLFDVFPSYGWQFVFVPIFGLIAVFILFFLYRNLKTRKQIIYVIVGFGCYASSVIFDFFEGMDESIYDPLVNALNSDTHTVVHFSKLIEELFEMVGNTFFMIAFTKQLLDLAENWKIKLVNSKTITK